MIQLLVPLMTQSEPSCLAVVRMSAAAEPASGSDRQKAGDFSPLAQPGRKRSFSSSEPKSWIGSVPSSWTMRIKATAGRGLRELLDSHLKHQRPGAGASVILREGKAQDVLLGEDLADVPRVFVGLVDLGGARRDLLLGDLADEVAEVLVLLGDRVEVGGRGGG